LGRGANAASIRDSTGRNDALEAGILFCRLALHDTARAIVPLDWAFIKTELGTALAILSGRMQDPARLREAISAFREALEELTSDRALRERADAQTKLSLALRSLAGVIGDGTLFAEAEKAASDAVSAEVQNLDTELWAFALSARAGARAQLGKLTEAIFDYKRYFQ